MKLFDLHCDTAWRCYKENLDFNASCLSVNSCVGKKFSEWKQCFAFFISEKEDCPFEYYKRNLADFNKKLLKKQGNITPIFTIEGGSVVESDISRAYEFYNDGIKAISLTWNGETELAGGVDTDASLKPMGKDFIKELNSLKIACDVSHLNKKSFWCVIERAQRVLATHSCFDKLNSHKRNLTDEQLIALKEKDGIVGICLYPTFLGKGNVFENFYRHIYHALDLGLEDNISIGSDFDGADMDKRLSNPDDLVALRKYLLNKGIESSVLDKLFFENANKFFISL